jgi:hypothetical protein
MELRNENHAFRTGYYLVGTTVIQMPAYRASSDCVTIRKTSTALESTDKSAGRTGLHQTFPRLVGHLKHLVASRAEIARASRMGPSSPCVLQEKLQNK